MRGFSFLIVLLCIFGNSVADPKNEFEDSYNFLIDNQPARDKDLSIGYIKKNVALAIAARHASPWAKEVEWADFQNYVLPYASVSENRDDWRPLFFHKFMPLVEKAQSTSEALQILNRQIWKFWNLKFKAEQTPKIMSPFEVIKYGYASCTGLAIFLVNACRSVGIPARVAGIPEWNLKTKGNHDWVEVLDNGKWYFTGAIEPTPELNQGWFYPYPTNTSLPGSRLHSIYGLSFAKLPNTVVFPQSWNISDTSVYAFDVTKRYL